MNQNREMVIEVKDLCNTIKKTLIHDHISFNVQRGEVLGLVGGSGAGKTVLLHTLLMLRRASSGRVTLLGHDIQKLGLDEKRRLLVRIGVMFQHGALFSGMTVLENVCFPLVEHTDLSPRLRRETAMLRVSMVGLKTADVIKYPAELSGGMIKRAALARALALEPEVLFLDEPTSGLDPVSADRFDHMIETLKSQLNLTVVMVTHDQDSLWRIVDRAAFLGEGKLLALGSPAELYENDHPMVRSYFQASRPDRPKSVDDNYRQESASRGLGDE